MVNDLDLFARTRQFLKHCARGVGAPVVDDQDFVFVGQGRKDLERADNKGCDGCASLKAGKNTLILRLIGFVSI